MASRRLSVDGYTPTRVYGRGYVVIALGVRLHCGYIRLHCGFFLEKGRPGLASWVGSRCAQAGL